MIKCILVDLDGTILNFKSGEAKAFINTIKEFAKVIPDSKDVEEFSNVNEKYFNMYQAGLLKRIDFQEQRFKTMSDKLKINFDASLANKYYINELKYMADLYDDSIECLEYLSKKYRLFVASNGINTVQLKRLEVAGISKYFEKIYISEIVGVSKPDKEFFDYVLNDNNDIKNDEFAIIGDRIEADILGGKNAKMTTILIDRTGKMDKNAADFYINSLFEIKNIL